MNSFFSVNDIVYLREIRIRLPRHLVEMLGTETQITTEDTVDLVQEFIIALIRDLWTQHQR